MHPCALLFHRRSLYSFCLIHNNQFRVNHLTELELYYRKRDYLTNICKVHLRGVPYIYLLSNFGFGQKETSVIRVFEHVGKLIERNSLSDQTTCALCFDMACVIWRCHSFSRAINRPHYHSTPTPIKLTALQTSCWTNSRFALDFRNFNLYIKTPCADS